MNPGPAMLHALVAVTMCGVLDGLDCSEMRTCVVRHACGPFCPQHVTPVNSEGEIAALADGLVLPVDGQLPGTTGCGGTIGHALSLASGDPGHRADSGGARSRRRTTQFL